MPDQTQELPVMEGAMEQATETTSIMLCTSKSPAEEALNLLPRISPDLSYPDWFRVAACLKHLGLKFSVFDGWSKGSSKYDVRIAEKVWEKAAAEGKPVIGIGTLKMLASGINMPMLAAPSHDAWIMSRQAANFLLRLFSESEYLELVFPAADGKTPRRNAQNILQVTDYLMDDGKILLEYVRQQKKGAWSSLNPVKQHIAGRAPSDADVTDYRYVLIEADELTKEEQWKGLCNLGLPIKAVTWSGNKSLHAIVRIDAGNDLALYKERVGKLYDYLSRKHFPCDPANKNPSRLTRIPGFFRDENMQYLVSDDFGPSSWEEFEVLYLQAPQDNRVFTSAINGANGGRPAIDVTAIAQGFLATTTVQGMPAIRFYKGEWWRYKNSKWQIIPADDLSMKVTGIMHRNGVQENGRIGGALVSDVLTNLKSEELLGLPSLEYTMPCWLPNGESGKGWICFNNGIVNISAILDSTESQPMEIRAHTPAFFSDKKVEYSYDPQAQHPMWDEYLTTTLESPELIATVQMMFGYILSGETNLNVGFFLTGEAGTGKSTTVYILQQLIGDDNTCSISFSGMGDRFNTSLLTEKSMNLIEETAVGNDMVSLANAEKIFKIVTGGGLIPVEKKFQAPSMAQATARCVFATNELPSFSDGSMGLWDRLIVIPYTKRFRKTSMDKGPDYKKRIADAEMSGILNWSIEGAKMLQGETSFPVCEAVKAQIDQHRTECIHEIEYLRSFTQSDPKGKISKRTLYSCYVNWAKDGGYHPKGEVKFNQAVKRFYREVTEERDRTNGADIMVWRGINFAGNQF